MFFRQPHLRGPSADRRETLPHDRNLSQKNRKFQKFGGPSPKKILGAKNMQNFGQFLQRPTDCEYLRNGLRYPNRYSQFSRSIPPAFYETDPVNFGPLISQI